MTRIRFLALAAALLSALGCATSAVDYVEFTYYIYGPEAAIDLLDENEVFPEDRALAEVERAVALLELGRYPESTAALARAEFFLKPGRSYDPKSPPWRSSRSSTR